MSLNPNSKAFVFNVALSLSTLVITGVQCCKNGIAEYKNFEQRKLNLEERSFADPFELRLKISESITEPQTIATYEGKNYLLKFDENKDLYLEKIDQ